MKSYVNVISKLAIAFSLVACASLAAQAQAGSADRWRLQLDSLDRLAPNAVQTINVNIDGTLLRFASSILSDKDSEEKTVKEAVAELRGVYVRSYEFKAEGQYAEGDVAQIRSQLRAPGWTRIVDVQKRGTATESAEVYVASEGGRVVGLVLLTTQPKELTVVNLVGSIDLDKLRKLEGNFGIPRRRGEKGSDGGGAKSRP